MTRLPSRLSLRALARSGFLLTLSFLPLLGACSYPSYRQEMRVFPQVDPWYSPKDVATICILRHEQTLAEQTFRYFDNGRLVAVTHGTGHYVCYLARPGFHRIIAQGPGAPAISFRASPGLCYYLQLTKRLEGIQLLPLHPYAARKLLPHLAYAYVTPSSNAPPLYRLPVPTTPTPTPRHQRF